MCVPSRFPSLAPSFPENHRLWYKHTEPSMTNFAAIKARSTKKQQSLVGTPFAVPQQPPHSPAQLLSSAPPQLLKDCNNSSLCQQGIFLNAFLPAGRQKPPLFFPGRFLFFVIIVIFPLDEKCKSSCLLLGRGNDSHGAAPRKTRNCLWQAVRKKS